MSRKGKIEPRAAEYRQVDAITTGAAKPGTSAFGQVAAARRAGIIERARRGDVRVKTAKKRVSGYAAERNKIIKGDY